MKKFISVMASAVMLTCFSAFPLTAHADYGITFEAGTVSTSGAVENGVLVQEETVTVPIRVTENQGVTTFLLEFTQDSNIEIISEKISAKESDFTSNGVNGSFMWNINALRLLWTENSCNDTNICGLVANLEVKVPAGTPEGKYEIGFNGEEIQVTNSNFDSIEFTVVPGYVEVGGNSANNTPAQTEPVAIQTTAAPAVTTKAPEVQPSSKQTQVQAQAAQTTKANAAETTVNDLANNASSVNTTETTKPSATSSDADSTAANAVQTDENGNIVTTTNVSGDISSSNTTSDSKITENTDNSEATDSTSKTDSDTNSAASVNNKKSSPSTGVSSGEIAVIGVILTVSAAGAVIAFKSKGKNK